MRAQLQQLYRHCFDDSEAFVDYYFQQRYTDDRTQYILRDEQPVAALQTLSYPMLFAGRLCATAYLSAVCTHPDYRHQGLMRDLLAQTHQTLAARGVAAAWLIPAKPWLYDVYAKQQYATVFYQETELISVGQSESETHCKVDTLTPELESAVFDFFNEQLLKKPYAILHTEEDFKVVLGALPLEHGQVLVAFTENHLSGVAFVTSEGKILELLSESPAERVALLREVGLRYRLQTVTCVVEPVSAAKKPFGMLRVISAEKLLKLYAATHFDCSMTINLLDEELPENNGCYKLSQGMCVKSEVTQEMPVWTIQQLTAFLFENAQPHVSLMLDD
ncbi:MAG: GNAT family N-acetyltransferase [Paludibacteraceae bacterium]|nr:GNAT family N-acetyltransferase [Paludibacteraceae bacterium]